jgi:hypothetical protein
MTLHPSPRGSDSRLVHGDAHQTIGPFSLSIAPHYDIRLRFMLDLMDITCPVLRSTLSLSIFTFFGYFGHSALGSILGLGLLGHGYFYKNRRSLRAGLTVLAVAMVTAGLAELLKYILPLTAVTSQTSYGIPSRKTSVAFGLASALSLAFPGLSPFFFGLATFVGISRLYFALESTGNVLSGAIIGLGCGLAISKRLIRRDHTASPSLLRLAAWFGICAFGLGALIFFRSMEKEIGKHLIMPANAARATAQTITFDFGFPVTRPFLGYGWSADERWDNGKRSVIWADGLASEIVMNLPLDRNYQFRFLVLPNAQRGPTCQSVEVRFNYLEVTRILLARNWHWYQFEVPKSAVRAGRNFIQFFYAYAESPRAGGRNSDERKLSVAFDVLEAAAKN